MLSLFVLLTSYFELCNSKQYQWVLEPKYKAHRLYCNHTSVLAPMLLLATATDGWWDCDCDEGSLEWRAINQARISPIQSDTEERKSGRNRNHLSMSLLTSSPLHFLSTYHYHHPRLHLQLASTPTASQCIKKASDVILLLAYRQKTPLILHFHIFVMFGWRMHWEQW